MRYSIRPELYSHLDKNGFRGIYIRIIYKRQIFKIGTNFKILPSQFDNGKIVKHPNSKNISFLLAKQINEIENRLLEALKISSDLENENILEILKGEKKVTSSLNDFIPKIIEQLEGKISSATKATYNTLLKDINLYKSVIHFNDVSVSWLNYFESYLRTKVSVNTTTIDSSNKKLHVNTINKKMKTLKTVLNRASEQGYIEKKNFEKYRIPKLVNSIPEFISESEMNELFLFSKNMKRPGHQLAVYYFLLSCYAGFRISDLKKFNYKEMVQNDTILIRAKKNGSIVSIPIYNKLNEILEEIKDKPLYLSEQKVREYVKEVAQFVGISRKIKIHTARHSFAMMMVNRGLSMDDVAELLGDSTRVAKVYARISNSRLKKEILEKMN